MDYNKEQLPQIESMINQYYAKYIAPILEQEMKTVKQKSFEEAKKEYTKQVNEHPVMQAFMMGEEKIDVAHIRTYQNLRSNPNSWNNKDLASVFDSVIDKITTNEKIGYDLATLAIKYENGIYERLKKDKYEKAKKRVQEQYNDNASIAEHYIQHKMRDLMLDHLARKKVPKNSISYIINQGILDSFVNWSFGVASKKISRLNDDLINERAEKLYNPSRLEKAAAWTTSFLFDSTMFGLGNSFKSAVKNMGSYLAMEKAAIPLMMKTKDKIAENKELLTLAFSPVPFAIAAASKPKSKPRFNDTFEDFSKLVFQTPTAFEKIKEKSAKYDRHSTEAMQIAGSQLNNKICKPKTTPTKFVAVPSQGLLQLAKGNNVKFFNIVKSGLAGQKFPHVERSTFPTFMLNFSSKQNRFNANSFYNQAKDMVARGQTTRNINGKKMTIGEVSQRAYDYAFAAVYTERKEYWKKQSKSATILNNILADFRKLNVSVTTKTAIPAWMRQKTYKECRDLAESFARHAKQSIAAKQTTKVMDGKTWTVAQMAQRAVDYERMAVELEKQQNIRKAAKQTRTASYAPNTSYPKTEAPITSKKAVDSKTSTTYSQQSVGNKSKDNKMQESPVKKDEKQLINDSSSQLSNHRSTQTVPNQASPGPRQEQSIPQNLQGWSGAIDSMGMRDASDIQKNLGYVIAMLPDMLIGMFTGKNENFRLENNLLPLAAIMGGMFFKNSPILQMMFLAYGGMSLLKNSGKESLAKRNQAANPSTQRVYKQYSDETLNPRIVNPIMKGDTLIATIDGKPLVIKISNTAVDAYEKGAVPLNTLANAVLRKYDISTNDLSTTYESQMRNVENEQRTAIAMR